MKYKILVDSCTDLPIQLKTDSHFKIIPLTLIIDDKIIVDNEDFNQKEFLNIMNKSPNSPKSACPSPEDYMREFEGDGDTYVVTISSELSGSYNSALLAKKLYLEEHPSSNKKIEVIDSRSASVGQTLIAMKIKELINSGHIFDEITEKIKIFRSEMKTKFVIESLENLRKNGRLSHIKAILSNVLNIKPVMGATPEGTICKLDQARGINKALIKMSEIIEGDVIKPQEKILGIAHCNCKERANFVKEEILKRVPFKDCFIVDTAGVSTMYANEGGIIVAY
ncbi:DegV family protein [Herbinix luporum]|jgi:DegV family protein with EDD domain|uniref:DegV family protein n=1 Tax=Herbinix luporum TaxID=1679721 RepID=UPI001755D3CB|nr:DegV family protein [Herbinix luporum]HHT56193.1 DegV family protein [Herbinix luporum]